MLKDITYDIDLFLKAINSFEKMYIDISNSTSVDCGVVNDFEVWDMLRIDELNSSEYVTFQSIKTNIRIQLYRRLDRKKFKYCIMRYELRNDDRKEKIQVIAKTR